MQRSEQFGSALYRSRAKAQSPNGPCGTNFSPHLSLKLSPGMITTVSISTCKESKTVKCQHCEKPATFHITELTKPAGPVIHHLCEEHARAYLAQENSGSKPGPLADMLAKELQLKQTAEELEILDKKTCPVCGTTFAEFRQSGRLGCAYDYICFQDDLDGLLTNIHGSKTHVGKRPKRGGNSRNKQHELIQLRREMQDAVTNEDYERAGEIRDQIRVIEQGNEVGEA